MTIRIGDAVEWVPTGETGTVLALTTEPSAIVLLPHGRQTIGLSMLRPSPDSEADAPRTAAYMRGALAALDVIAAGLQQHGYVDPEDIHQARERFSGSGS